MKRGFCWRIIAVLSVVSMGLTSISQAQSPSPGRNQKVPVRPVNAAEADARLAKAAQLAVSNASQARVKDLASIQGVRSNPLIGYGLIVGLDGTGDKTNQTPFTSQSVISMLNQSGVVIPPDLRLQTKNAASVMVTAELPPYSQPGQRIDVTVSSIGNAKSIKGGTLLMTPLKGVDGQIYAIAQGNVVVTGAGAEANGSSTKINHLSAGRVPNGAMVEAAVDNPALSEPTLDLQLHTTDFSNASSIAAAINLRFGDGVAFPKSGRSVQLRLPDSTAEKIEFLSVVQDLVVSDAVQPARIIVNARTGSVVMNQAVKLLPSAVAHGNLTIQIRSAPVISQPNPFGRGETVVTEASDIQIEQSGGELIQLPPASTLTDLVRTLNTLGAKPQDLVSIIQALKESGSIRAELTII